MTDSFKKGFEDGKLVRELSTYYSPFTEREKILKHVSTPEELNQNAVKTVPYLLGAFTGIMLNPYIIPVFIDITEQEIKKIKNEL